ncbi:hypothetical protein N7491_009193 [Penicillium cf. griseofulvum]|nr:hypothetical protein N7491_009193 [Penicillium cf. griseofulvum]
MTRKSSLEFWEKLTDTDESFPVLADERADVNYVSVLLSPITQLACEDLEEPRILEQNLAPLDDKATEDRVPKVSVALYDQTIQAKTDQNKFEDNNQPVCGVPDTCSIVDQYQTQATPHSTTECIANEPYGSGR